MVVGGGLVERHSDSLAPPSGDGPFADDWGANRYDLLGSIINQAIQRGDDLGATLANIFPPPDHPQPTLGPEAHLAFEALHPPESVRHSQPRPDSARQTTAASGNPDTSNISTFDIAQSRLQDLMAAQTYVQIMDEDVTMSDQATNANTASGDQSIIPWSYYFQQLDGQYKRGICTIMTGPTNIKGPGPFDVPYGDLGPRMRMEGHDCCGYGHSSTPWSCLKMTISGLKVSLFPLSSSAGLGPQLIVRSPPPSSRGIPGRCSRLRAWWTSQQSQPAQPLSQVCCRCWKRKAKS